MAFIYDLDNEYGGVILSDSDSTNPALQVNSNAAGQPALAIYSTASTNPLVVRAIQAGNASVVSGGSLFRSVVTTSVAATFDKTFSGSPTIGTIRIGHTSTASGAVIGFGGGFISVTSILGTAATGAAIAFDYVLPVELNGIVRGIPLTSLLSLPGAAVF